VIPVYNEAHIIENLVKSYYNEVIAKIPGSELIIAEDGSTDGTKDILKKLRKKLPFILISGNIRKGYNKAVKDALAMPKNDIIFFSDSSGQHSPGDFFKLAREIGKYDMVIGYKHARKDPHFRIILSKGYNLITRLLFGVPLHDINCGFRIIKREVVKNLLKETTTFKLKFSLSTKFQIQSTYNFFTCSTNS
jgi:glycosyltransferase involved in cell wall biosynthesis